MFLYHPILFQVRLPITAFEISLMPNSDLPWQTQVCLGHQRTCLRLSCFFITEKEEEKQRKYESQRNWFNDT